MTLFIEISCVPSTYLKKRKAIKNNIRKGKIMLKWRKKNA
jgi:hypothetical protein